MILITQCIKCSNELSPPVPDDRIGDNLYLCQDCKEALDEEKNERNLYDPPEMRLPYKP